MTEIAHVSDLSIDGTERSVKRAERVLEYLRHLRSPWYTDS
jgi:hypothetical protein